LKCAHGVYFLRFEKEKRIELEKMSSHIKHLCESISRKQIESIRDLTSGHLNENHLYRPRATINGKRKPSWTSSQKPHPTLRPAHRLQDYSQHVEQMKDTLIDFTYLTLPEINNKKLQKQTPRVIFSFFSYSLLKILFESISQMNNLRHQHRKRQVHVYLQLSTNVFQCQHLLLIFLKNKD